MPKNHLLIIDVPALVFRGFYALPSLTTPDGEPAGALYGFVSLLMKAIETVKPTHIAAALDLPEPTFRHRAYKEYKATRPEMPEELSSQFGRIPTILYAKKAVTERFGIGSQLIVSYKALRGDPSDNIPGVVGIGENGASQI